MEVSRRPTRQTTPFSLVVLGLATITSAMGALLWITLRAAPHAEPPRARALTALAWMSLVLMLGALLLLVWAVARHVRLSMMRTKSPPSEQHKDAWVEAGKRIKVDPSETPEAPPGAEDS